jgi:hypothetical protein
MQRPIFLLGAHKSGTSLLRALFDGHPDLFVLPIETHFCVHLGWWVAYPFRRRAPRAQSYDDFLADTAAWVRHANQSEDPQSDGVVKGFFDEARFETYLRTHLDAATTPSQSTVHYIETYMAAVAAALHMPDIAHLRFVEKSVENAEFALDLASLFPDAVFVHIVRNPYANLVSIRKYKTFKAYPDMYPCLHALTNSFYFLYRNRRLIPQYHVGRYEDLVQKPQEVIRDLCSWADVSYTESMVMPTQLGKPWAGNSTASVAFRGISAQRLDGWQRDITPIEVALINRHLAHVLHDFDYDLYQAKQSPLMPARREGIRHYIRNRMLWSRGI